MKRQPVSKFEKLVEGLTKLLVAQPAARVSVEEGKLFVGDTTDPFISRGLKDYMKNMGFEVEKECFMFHTKEEKKYGKF